PIRPSWSTSCGPTSVIAPPRCSATYISKDEQSTIPAALNEICEARLRELEMPTRTFLNWYRRADYTAYAFNTRPVTKHPCQKAFLFYMNRTRYDPVKKQVISTYSRYKSKPPYCRWKMDSPEDIDSIVVSKRPDPLRWQRVRMLGNSNYYIFEALSHTQILDISLILMSHCYEFET
ncbi:fringe-like protein, partial [Trifolium medium]|nr:fringe-like protein [Trifolium medium]